MEESFCVLSNLYGRMSSNLISFKVVLFHDESFECQFFIYLSLFCTALNCYIGNCFCHTHGIQFLILILGSFLEKGAVQAARASGSKKKDATRKHCNSEKVFI